MPKVDIAYDKLPEAVKDNIAPEQWAEAQSHVILDGHPVPDTTDYINLKNGQCLRYQAGEPANGPLLPTHDLAGGRGRDDLQFREQPPGAHHPVGP